MIAGSTKRRPWLRHTAPPLRRGPSIAAVGQGSPPLPDGERTQFSCRAEGEFRAKRVRGTTSGIAAKRCRCGLRREGTGSSSWAQRRNRHVPGLIAHRARTWPPASAEPSPFRPRRLGRFAPCGRQGRKPSPRGDRQAIAAPGQRGRSILPRSVRTKRRKRVNSLIQQRLDLLGGAVHGLLRLGVAEQDRWTPSK